MFSVSSWTVTPGEAESLHWTRLMPSLKGSHGDFLLSSPQRGRRSEVTLKHLHATVWHQSFNNNIFQELKWNKLTVSDHRQTLPVTHYVVGLVGDVLRVQLFIPLKLLFENDNNLLICWSKHVRMLHVTSAQSPPQTPQWSLKSYIPWNPLKNPLYPLKDPEATSESPER